jgi:hypothetical protein
MFPAAFTPPPKWFLRAFIRFRRSVATKPDHAAVRDDLFQVCNAAHRAPGHSNSDMDAWTQNAEILVSCKNVLIGTDRGLAFSAL